MSKVLEVKRKAAPKKRTSRGLTTNTNKEDINAALMFTQNATLLRQELLNKLLDGNGRDIDTECGYPSTISAQEYHNMYEREGIAARVVDVWPEESWSTHPTIYETEDPENMTEFETKWEELAKKHKFIHFLSRADQLSGVGRYGILLIGINDGLELSEPVDGVNITGDGRTGAGGVTRELIYLRPFDESVVDIAEFDLDVTSPRFSFPTYYNINFRDDKGNSFCKRVHWHRIVHFADLREMSEVYGTPRMKKNYNRLLDIRKILGGSGEMFWKGGFPGYSFEVNQGEGDGGVEVDATSIREEMEKYMNGLQRYLALTGVSAKSLAPQVADPRGHLEAQLDAIAIAVGIPKRKFFGSEQGELASSQDDRTWNRRLKRRQDDYLTPNVVRPFVDRLIALGILPVVEEYFVSWDDINTQTDQEKADVARSWAEALAKYVAGGVDQVVPPEEFLGILGKLPPEVIKQIKKAMDKYIVEEEALARKEEEEAQRMAEEAAAAAARTAPQGQQTLPAEQEI